MKAKKAKILSLFLLLTLAGCQKTSDVTSDKPSDTAKSSDTQTSDSKSDVEKKPTSVSIKTDRNYLYVNEELSLSASFEPSDSSDDYRLTSSDPDIISVTGRKITGVSATNENEEVTITLTTDGGLTATAKFVVYDVINHVTELLNTSHTLALENATGGSLDITSYEDDQDDFNESISYNIYKNSSEVIEEVTEGTSYVSTIYNRAIIGDSYIESRRRKNGTSGDYVNVNGYLENRSIVDTVTDKYREYTMEEAKERISNVQICSSTSIGTRGMEGFVLDQFLTNVSSFGSSYAKSAITMEENLSSISNIYTLSYDYTRKDSTTRIEEKLVLEFDSTGLLINVDDALNEYEGEESKLVANYVVSGVQMSGDKEDAPEGSFDFSEYFFDDFDVIFHSDMFDYSSDSSDTIYNVGDTAFLMTYDNYMKHSPSTATTYIDPIKITSVSEPDAVEIIYGNRIKFKKLVADLEVTVQSTIKKVEKKITLHCVPPQTTKIQFGEFLNPDTNFAQYSATSSAHYLPSSWILGTDREVWVVGEKVQQSPDITVTSSNTDVATVSLIEGSSNKFTFHPVKAGKTTIKVVDKTLGEEKALTKEITIYDNSDSGIADLLRESNFTPYNTSLYSDFDFSGTANTNTGDFSGKYCDSYDIWGSWIVEDGEIKVTTYSGAFGEVTYGSSAFVLTDITFSNYAKYGPTNLTIKGSSQSVGEIGDGSGTGIVLY